MLPKYKAKTSLLQFLDKLPPEAGFRAYHFLQQKIGNVSLQQQIDSSHASYLTLVRIAENLNIRLGKKSFLEIGSGWVPLIPYFFKFLSGAKEVYTYDLNRHYDTEKIEELNTRFNQQFGVSISSYNGNEYGLPGDIHYFPNTDLTKVKLPLIDIVFSRFVLEHVEPRDILKMHRKFREELPKGTYIMHLISPSDHRAYDNKELSLQDFLRYSAEEWNKKQTKFDYHNRLRLPQYVDLFESLGFEITFLEYDCPKKDSEAYKKFKEVPIHEDFQQFSEEDLMAGGINIVLKT